MARLILIRHAQASFSESNYDQLSVLGHRQAELLGRYLESTSFRPDNLICGTLQRHQQTLHNVVASLAPLPNPKLCADWNEFDFKNILKAYCSLFEPDALAKSHTSDKKAFFRLLRKSVTAWSEGELDEQLSEPWHVFQTRVQQGLNDIRLSSNQGETTMLVSSGGVISMAIALTLKLDVESMLDLNFQLRNSSISSLEIKKDKMVLESFNQVPHLETSNEKNMISYV